MNLNTDRMARALLAYRNTPSKDLGLSPAQILYGRILRDHLPIPGECLLQRKEWIMMKADREKALSVKYGHIQEELSRGAHPLLPLEAGSIVQVHNQRGNHPLKWDRSGIVVESLGNQQYTVRMDGSGRVSLRNRKFLRKIEPLVPRHVAVGNVVHDHSEAVVGERHVDNDGVVSVEDDDGQGNTSRRSTRVRRSPERYQAT